MHNIGCQRPGCSAHAGQQKQRGCGEYGAWEGCDIRQVLSCFVVVTRKTMRILQEKQ